MFLSWVVLGWKAACVLPKMVRLDETRLTFLGEVTSVARTFRIDTCAGRRMWLCPWGGKDPVGQADVVAVASVEWSTSVPLDASCSENRGNKVTIGLAYRGEPRMPLCTRTAKIEAGEFNRLMTDVELFDFWTSLGRPVGRAWAAEIAVGRKVARDLAEVA